MAVVFSLVLVVQGTFRGVEQGIDQRVEDFFTGDLRITAGAPTAAPSHAFANASAVRAQLESDTGGTVLPRLETQFVLSRRGFLEGYFEEDERFDVAVPGATPDQDALGIGVLAGVAFEDPAAAPAREAIRRNLVSGGLPDASDAQDDPVQILISGSRLRSYMSEEERAVVGHPPDASAVRRLRFEISSFTVHDKGDLDAIIVKAPAEVVGVFSTDLDALDSFTLVAPIEDVRRLSGEDPQDGPTNVVTLHGGDVAAAERRAEARGWSTEGSGAFSQRYISELVTVIQGLAVVLASLFFALPLFLVWHGLSQQLALQQRELAVCRAIGVGPASVFLALLYQVAWTVAVGALAACGLVAIAAWRADAILAERLPVPVAFEISPGMVAAVVLAGAVATATAVGLTLLRHTRGNVALALRVA